MPISFQNRAPDYTTVIVFLVRKNQKGAPPWYQEPTSWRRFKAKTVFSVLQLERTGFTDVVSHSEMQRVFLRCSPHPIQMMTIIIKSDENDKSQNVQRMCQHAVKTTVNSCILPTEILFFLSMPTHNSNSIVAMYIRV